MRALVMLTVLCASLGSVALAGPQYIYLGVREDISAADRQACREEFRRVIRDASGVYPNAAELPRWRVVANPSIVFRIICVDKTKPGSPLRPLDITAAQFETWKATHLTEPNKVQVKAGDTDAVVYAAGLEPVPQVEP